MVLQVHFILPYAERLQGKTIQEIALNIAERLLAIMELYSEE